MDSSPKSKTRRAEIRKNRPDVAWVDWAALRGSGALTSGWIALAFWLVASAILVLRQDVVPYRAGQWIPHDVVGRVDFAYRDDELLAQKRREARENEPRVYKANPDTWTYVQRELLTLPDKVAEGSADDLAPPLRGVLDAGAVTALRQHATRPNRETYAQKVRDYVDGLKSYRLTRGLQQYELFVLPAGDRREDAEGVKPVVIEARGTIDADLTFAADSPELRAVLKKLAAESFTLSLQPQIVELTVGLLAARPTHVLDAFATTEARNAAEARVTREDARVKYPANAILVPKAKGKFEERDWHLLQAENQQYRASLGESTTLKTGLGVAGTVLLMTIVMAGYVAHFQPRVVRNHARGLAIAALLLSMLLLAQVAGIGNGPLHLFGVAPTLLVAMILTIAYDARFAMGLSSMHGLLVTFAVDQGIAFFLVIWVGVLAICFLLDDIRTRSKLIEVGGAASLAMIAATLAAGALSLDPWRFILKDCLYTGGAGLAVGFVVLGILPFVEKAFRITTSMTLLELADSGQPLLRRLAVEAPGTYNHSLQVATLSEAAAEAIGANSLLCRVGAYYHDVGKMNKADYFIENQQPGCNRHINLNPSVSLLIIIGHVKDGVELAREYNLPTSLVNFIQQHHGTTLVEYFYHQACTQKDQRQPDHPAVSETQYRYPGPKPRVKEIAIVMLADAVESACRAMSEPTASRVETLVHDLALKRLLDGQFDDCDLTMRDLDLIERSMVKTLLGIYHGRIAYPSTSATQQAAPTGPMLAPTMRSA
jgi:putative nucleotidyltransferase with HDIG domain